jgi:flagellar hook-basal body complex protein FliE
MSDVAINQVLAQMRAMAVQAAGGAEATTAAGAAGAPPGGFAQLLKSSLDAVNTEQQRSGAVTEAFVRGDPGVSLPQVMIAQEKASLAFEAVSQTRNRLLSAYRDIMSMPL